MLLTSIISKILVFSGLRPQEHSPLDGLSTRRTANPVDPVVDLPYGSYKGYHNASTGIDVWRSIRYAAPPTGQYRWRAPQRPKNETGTGTAGKVIDARDWPKQCLMSSAGDMERGRYSPLATTDDEDCLFLSVYKPKDAENLPVYVWFHGVNSAREFEGQPMVQLSNNSIIHVTVQYRLGIFGYLASPQMGDGLNAGLKDAAFSLQWVQDYIHLFGGDPNRVTIGGESAGGGFVLNLLAAQSVEGRPTLFHNAFAASPGGLAQGRCDSGFWKDQWEKTSRAAGCHDDIECMRNASITKLRILNADNDGQGIRGYRTANAMCVEGPGGYVTEPPAARLYAGRTTAANVVVGGNFNDAYGPARPLPIEPSSDSPTYKEDADAMFIGYLLKSWPIRDDDFDSHRRLINLYPLSDFPNNSERAKQAQQDIIFMCPGQFAADAANKVGAASYRYLYAVPPGYHAQDNAQEYPWFYYKKEGSPDSPSLFRSFTGSIISLVQTGNPSKSSTPNLRPADDPEWTTWSRGDDLFKVFNVTERTNISDAYIAGSGDRWAYRIGTRERCDFWGEIRTRDQW